MLLAAAFAATLAVAAPPADALDIGTLHFTSCELPQIQSSATTAAHCAPFRVPEDRAAPDARRIDLRLALIRSETTNAAPDPVVLLAGGPGQAATESWPQVAAALAPLRRHRHVLLLDQRGTGGSNKLDCKDDEPSAEREVGGEPGGEPDGATIARVLGACVTQLAGHADPRHYTTSDAVEDLEALRQALGGVKFNLVGISYGTRVAQQYARRHPDGVRSLVLDGVVPNELVLGAEFADALDGALRGRFAACEKDPACRERYGDLHATLYAVRDRLRRAPIAATVANPRTYQPEAHRLTASGFGTLVRLYAYTSETSALLPLVIGEAAHGNVAPLLGQLRLVGGEFDAAITGGMGLSVICAEDADLLDVRERGRDRILGADFVAALKAQCAAWPHGTRPADFHQPLKTDLPLLALSGEFDPVTPPRYGETVVGGAAHGRHLVALGQGHNVIGRGCLPKLVKEFVEKLAPEKIDAGCLAEMGPTAFFLDYNGAAP